MRRTRPPFGRRPFLQGALTLAALGVLGCGRASTPEQAQVRQSARMPMLGVCVPGMPPTRPTLEGFRRGLREAGYVEGESITLEVRWDRGDPDAWPELIADLLRAGVDLLLAGPTPSHRPALQATSTVPIVAPTMADPVRDGLVESLARPGGNLTGLTLFQPLLNAKRLELLKGVVPAASEVAFAWWAGYADPELPQVEAAARSHGVRLIPREVQAAEELDDVFRAAAEAGADAVLLALGAPFTTHVARVVELGRRSRLPTIAGETGFAAAGGLMNYGPNVVENWRRAAAYVDKILKGARPADLPVEQPTAFDFVINLKTAQALGLTIPSSVVQQATEVIQ